MSIDKKRRWQGDSETDGKKYRQEEKIDQEDSESYEDKYRQEEKMNKKTVKEIKKVETRRED